MDIKEISNIIKQIKYLKTISSDIIVVTFDEDTAIDALKDFNECLKKAFPKHEFIFIRENAIKDISIVTLSELRKYEHIFHNAILNYCADKYPRDVFKEEHPDHKYYDQWNIPHHDKNFEEIVCPKEEGYRSKCPWLGDMQDCRDCYNLKCGDNRD